MTARSPQRQQLQDLLDPVVSAAGYELVELSVTAAGRRSLIRATVDGPEGIDLDAVADLSRAISAALDSAEDGGNSQFAGPYVLEVSSPGVDRPLTEPKHWRLAVGRLVSVDIAGQPVTGRVVSADITGLVLRADSTAATASWSWAEVGRGRVQVEFNRPGEVHQGAAAEDDAGQDMAGDLVGDAVGDAVGDVAGNSEEEG